jgi:uncharacterized Zn ribbon protein
MALLNDGDQEIIVQALKMLGNNKVAEAGTRMIEKAYQRESKNYVFRISGIRSN